MGQLLLYRWSRQSVPADHPRYQIMSEGVDILPVMSEGDRCRVESIVYGENCGDRKKKGMSG